MRQLQVVPRPFRPQLVVFSFFIAVRFSGARRLQMAFHLRSPRQVIREKPDIQSIEKVVEVVAILPEAVIYKPSTSGPLCVCVRQHHRGRPTRPGCCQLDLLLFAGCRHKYGQSPVQKETPQAAGKRRSGLVVEMTAKAVLTVSTQC